MRRLWVALAFLLAVSVSAQEYNVPFHPRAAAGGGSAFCDSAPTNIFCEDFEEGVACASLTTAPTVTGAPNCTYTTTALDGTYSLNIVDNAVTDSLLWEDAFNTTSDVQLKFHFYVVSDDSSTNTNYFAGFYDASDVAWGHIYYDDSLANGGIWATNGVNGGGAGITNAVGSLAATTEYIVCLEHDVSAGTYHIALDLPSDDDCDGDALGGGAESTTGPGDEIGSSPTSLNDLLMGDVYNFGGEDDHATIIIDNIIVTEESF